MSGNWRAVVCGISHKTSLLEQREPLQLGSDEIARANAVFSNLPQVLESAIVSTCNRVEFYFTSERTSEPFETVASFYKEFKDLDIEPFRDLFQTKKGKHVADHFFRVAAGIDSMVLGENQIMGQIKDAYSSACATKSAGKIIHRLFHQAFRVGKQVRSDTEMGKGACSVSSAAVEMLKSRLAAFPNPTILFIGVNQMIKLAASRLGQLENSRLVFANRTAEKAVEFASTYHAEGHGLENLASLITEANILISCTSATNPVVTSQIMDEVMPHRTVGKLVIMDLAIPRDVDLPKDWDSSVELYNLEDIKSYVRDQQGRREQAIPQVEEIIERRLAEFDYWYKHVLQEPIYNGYSNTIESVRKEELSEILHKLSPELRNELDRVTKRMVNRVFRVTSRATQGS